MFTRQDKVSAPRTKSRVLALLGIASFAAIGFMGYDAFRAGDQSQLDLNSLPSDNAAEWERIAQVDEIITTMRGHYAAVASNFRGIHEATSTQQEALFNLVGGIVEGEEIVFSHAGRSPKAVMGQVVHLQNQNTKSARQTAQSVGPDNLKKAIEFVRSQKSFLEKANIDVSGELDALSVTNNRFKHISMELGSQAHKVYQEARSTEALMDSMVRSEKNMKSMSKLFQLTFKRLLRMLEATLEQMDDMEVQLTEINGNMQHSINRLEQSNADAYAYYQKKVDELQIEEGRAKLKVDQLQKEYIRESKAEPFFKPRKVHKPADPRQMRLNCNPKQVVGQKKVYVLKTFQSGFWIFSSTYTKRVFSHMADVYRDCATEVAGFQNKMQAQWAQEQAIYQKELVAVENSHNDRLEKWQEGKIETLKGLMKMQNSWEEKAYISQKKMTQTIDKQMQFSKHLIVIITYQEAIKGSQNTIIYICMKFKKSIASSMRLLHDTHDIMGPGTMEEEEAVSLFEYDAEDLDDLFGSKRDISHKIHDIGVDAEQQDMKLYINTLKQDIVHMKIESHCTERAVALEVKKWASLGLPGYSHHGKLPKICTQIEGATRKATSPPGQEDCDDMDPMCDPFV